MSHAQRPPLAVLADLRDREKQRLLRDVAEQRALAERHRATLARLMALGEGAGASGAQSGAHLSVLSLNCGNYKQHVHVMVAGQKDVLGMREAELRRAEQDLRQAALRHEALAQLLESREEQERREDERREQKKQDELATQRWGNRHDAA